MRTSLSLLVLLRIEVCGLLRLVCAKRRRKILVVLTVSQVERVLGGMTGPPRPCTALLYGSGLRAMEGLRLRTENLDIETDELIVQKGKGKKDRRTVLPETLKLALTSI